MYIHIYIYLFLQAFLKPKNITVYISLIGVTSIIINNSVPFGEQKILDGILLSR